MKKLFKAIALVLAMLMMSTIVFVACDKPVERTPEYGEETEQAIRLTIEGILQTMPIDLPIGSEGLLEEVGDNFILALQSAYITEADINAIFEFMAELMESGFIGVDIENPMSLYEVIGGILPLPISNTKLAKFVYFFAEASADFIEAVVADEEVLDIVNEVLALGEAGFTSAVSALLDLVVINYSGSIIDLIIGNPDILTSEEAPSLQEFKDIINAYKIDYQALLNTLNQTNVTAICNMVKIFVPYIASGEVYDDEIWDYVYDDDAYQANVALIRDILTDVPANFAKFKASMTATLNVINNTMIEALYNNAVGGLNYNVLTIIVGKLLHAAVNASGGLNRAAIKTLVLKYAGPGVTGQDYDAMADMILPDLAYLNSLSYTATLTITGHPFVEELRSMLGWFELPAPGTYVLCDGDGNILEGDFVIIIIGNQIEFTEGRTAEISRDYIDFFVDGEYYDWCYWSYDADTKILTFENFGYDELIYEWVDVYFVFTPAA